MRIHHRRSVRAALVVLASLAVVTAGCSSSDDKDADGANAAANAELLGPENRATGSPIKIGLVTDGRSDAIDHTAAIAAFKATVQYVNEHLGGINGHVIEVAECETGNTPSGATKCAVQMATDQVAATLVPTSAQDAAVFTGLADSGIPYVTYTAASQEIFLQPGAFLFTNPVATVSAPAKLAKDDGIDKVGFILIDVPAATGPISLIAEPIYQKAGVALEVTPISPQTADMTPQVQQAISDGAGLFAVTGTDEFAANGIKTLQQLGFTGTIVLGTPPTPTVVEGVPGGLEGVVNNGTITGDPDDPDVKLYRAVMDTYAADTALSAQSPWAFALVLGFVKALEGTEAVDAASITTALGSMPAPIALPMGGGITFQCGSEPVSFAPNICAANVLTTTLDAEGNGTSWSLLDVKEYLTLG